MNSINITMDEDAPITTSYTHYAILVGIDEYPVQPLTACVRDVHLMAELIRNELHGSAHIELLTAPRGDGLSLEAREVQVECRSWPTYENVANAFNRATSRAQSGDSIYFHYSGHGTNKAPSNDSATGGLAVVLLDNSDKTKVAELPGKDLASWLMPMIKNDLAVTVALDCCFSAGLYRHSDPSIRFLPFDPDIFSVRAPSDTIRYSPGGGGASPAIVGRDASTRLTWLLDPAGYGILAACGPAEVAKEKKISEHSHGVFTYMLLKALVRCGSFRATLREIHRHLRASLYGFQSVQNPALLGNADQAFFGQAGARNTGNLLSTASTVVVGPGGTLLLAGQAHGVCIDDRFDLLAPDTVVDSTNPTGDWSIFRVTEVGPLTSKLVPCGSDPIDDILTGWTALPRMRLALRRFPVFLHQDLGDRLEGLRSAMQGRSLEVLVDEGGDPLPASFRVRLRNGQYQILDASGRSINNLPPMPQDQTDFGHVCNIIEHLARFHHVKELAHDPSSPGTFHQSFAVRVKQGDVTFCPGEVIKVRHNESTLQLQAENRGEDTLFFHVCNLKPHWKVANAISEDHVAIAKSRKKSWRITMTVPEDMIVDGRGSCEDIIKVFVTSNATSLDLLELPRLGEQKPDT
ncbi:hypothetical protein Sste5344_010526, partial [Sporothrix stenoceras]